MSNNRACGGSVYYIREPNGALIARVVGTTLDATTTRYYHFDALGSTRKLTDKDGVVTDTYSYDAWGNTTHTGSTDQPYQYVGQLGYYTHYQDENLDLLQLGVRFYDPRTGRFTQRDPIARDQRSGYPYADDAPMLRSDPSGRLPIGVVIAPIIGFGAGYAIGCILAARADAANLMNDPEVLRRANENEYFPPVDLLAHCYAACRATRCVLRLSCLASRIVSYMDSTHDEDSPEYMIHWEYNHAGLAFGLAEGDCLERCFEYGILRGGEY